MRTREKSYKDYGITEDEKKYILNFCRTAGEKDKELVKKALKELNPYISPHIYRSLTENLSYDDLCKTDYLYMHSVDFYAYRRKGIAAIKRHMIQDGIWNK